MNGMMRFSRSAVTPLLGGSPAIPSSEAQYPWVDGDMLCASPLNAAIAQAGSVHDVTKYGAMGDGFTDDTAAIQNVLNTYAGTGIVYIPNTGSFYLCNSLTVPSGTELWIDGTIKLRPSPTTHLLYVNNASNVTIRGHGTLDGNNTVNTYPTVQVGVLFILSSTNVQVLGLTVQNAPLWDLVAQQSSKILFSGVTMSGGRNASGFSVNCDDCWLMNSTVIGPDDDIGFAFYSGITNSGAIGNKVSNSGIVNVVSAVGINVLADNIQGAACSNIIIADNFVTNCGGSGIAVTSSVAARHDAIIISNNRCYNNGKRPIGNRGDIDLNGCTNVLVIGNQSANFGSNTDPWYGLAAWNAVGGGCFIGNLIYGTGQGGTAGAGMYVSSSGALHAAGNFFYDYQTTPTMAASIAGTAGPQNVFVGNHCERPVTLILASDTVFNNAVGGATQMAVNSSSEAPLWINGPAGVNRMPVFTTSGVARWYFGLDNTTEPGGGANSGSNFQLMSCNDTGAAVRTPLSINRLTGLTMLVNLSLTALTNAANDAAAASAGVAVNQVYRNGSVLQVRVT